MHQCELPKEIRTTRSIGLTTIKKIRLECKKCYAAMELPIDHLARILTPGWDLKCPVCDPANSFQLVKPTDSRQGAWPDLAKILPALWTDNDNVKVEFILQDESAVPSELAKGTA
jgi:hypothetical protein